MSMKNSNDTIGNRTRDLPTCSAVPEPTAPPRTPLTHRDKTPNFSVTQLHRSLLRHAFLYKQRLQTRAHRRFYLVTHRIHVDIHDTFKDWQTTGVPTGRKCWATSFYENKDIWLNEERMTCELNEAFLCGQLRYKYFEAVHSVHYCSQSLCLFQLNAHNMLNTYIYHQLPPTCFSVTPSSGRPLLYLLKNYVLFTMLHRLCFKMYNITCLFFKFTMLLQCLKQNVFRPSISFKSYNS